MEEFITFTGVVMIAFGILQIILFFKIWGMTNNVKRIRAEVDNKDFISEACYTYAKGNIEETEKLLNEAFLKEACILSKSANDFDWFGGYDKLVSKYTRAFNKINKPAPDFKKYRDPQFYLL